jgi:hypothetical protein
MIDRLRHYMNRFGIYECKKKDQIEELKVWFANEKETVRIYRAYDMINITHKPTERRVHDSTRSYVPIEIQCISHGIHAGRSIFLWLTRSRRRL